MLTLWLGLDARRKVVRRRRMRVLSDELTIVEAPSSPANTGIMASEAASSPNRIPKQTRDPIDIPISSQK